MGQSPADRNQSCRISPKERITWIKTSAEVRMSDPDLEKNNVFSAQYKLAIVTIIPVPTWEARASVSVMRPREVNDIPTSLSKALL